MLKQVVPKGVDLCLVPQTGEYTVETEQACKPVNLKDTHNIQFSPDYKTMYYWNIADAYIEFSKACTFDDEGNYAGCRVVKYKKHK